MDRVGPRKQTCSVHPGKSETQNRVNRDRQSSVELIDREIDPEAGERKERRAKDPRQRDTQRQEITETDTISELCIG